MKRFAQRVMLVVVAFALAAACGKGGDSADPKGGSAEKVNLHDAGPPGDAAKGAEVYKKVCMACHQKDGRGMNGALAADFRGDGARLQKPDSVLLKSIREGKTSGNLVMPAQKDNLRPQEIKDALAYVRATFGTPDTK